MPRLQVLGSGTGVYDPATHASQLNTKNPPFRDTATLPKNGWVVLRFVSDNPGVSEALRCCGPGMHAAPHTVRRQLLGCAPTEQVPGWSRDAANHPHLCSCGSSTATCCGTSTWEWCAVAGVLRCAALCCAVLPCAALRCAVP